jgi:hypothetical protein
MSTCREATISVILCKIVYMCPIPNGFRDRAISLYSSKIVYKKHTLRTLSITGIYRSSDKVGTVYLLYDNAFSKIPPSTIVHFATLVEYMACCSSECIFMFLYAGNDIHRSVSEPVWNTYFVA